MAEKEWVAMVKITTTAPMTINSHHALRMIVVGSRRFLISTMGQLLAPVLPLSLDPGAEPTRLKVETGPEGNDEKRY
jgi:hypothetical protein